MNYPKITIAAIIVGVVTIIGLSWYWYGADPLFFPVVGLFVVAGIVIVVSRYLLKRKNRKGNQKA